VHEPRSCSAGNLAAKPLTWHLRWDPRAVTLFDRHGDTLGQLRRRGLQARHRRGAVLQPDEDWRGLARRYDKLAVFFRGGVVLAAIVDWLR